MNPNQILQGTGRLVLGTIGTAQRFAGRVTGGAFGLAGRGSRQPKPDMDDATLTNKVESEIFRNTRGVKASVNVNAVDGVVWLRGEVKRPEQIRNLEQKALAVPEVRGVENLLHLAKTPAPTRADTPSRQQRTRSSTRRPTPRRGSTGRVTDDRTDAIERHAEPSPAEHEARHEGRTPAPLGDQTPTDDSP